MWIMINISAFCFLETGNIRIVLFVLGAIGTASILWFVPTYERTDRPRGEFFHTDWTGEGGATAAGNYNA